MLQIIETPPALAFENMEWDAKYLEQGVKPCLHLYSWKHEAATYGYFLSPKDFFKEGLSLDLARRPTGGGVVFHIWDLAFSFFLPATHPYFYTNSVENYRFVNKIVWEAVSSFMGERGSFVWEEKGVIEKNVCMAHPTKYDVVVGDKKLIGAAQRRTKRGYLHQGMISLLMPSREYLERVLIRKEIVDEMFRYTYSLFTDGDITLLRKEVSASLQKAFGSVVF
ncbi:MAG: hypothetical protein WCP39_04495 [Chlamydiota bacterium]